MKTFGFSIRRALLCSVLLSVSLFWSCQKEPAPADLAVPSVSKIDPTDPVYQYILSLGFNEKDIVDLGDSYVVEGDIGFDKNLDLNQGAKLSHTVDGISNIVSYGPSGGISVRLINNFADSYDYAKVRSALLKAMNNWNGISGSGLKFVYSTGSSASITVSRDNSIIIDGYDAKGAFAMNCAAGPTIQVTQNAIALADDKLEFILTHELGHNIGFRHTDSGTGVDVPGTPLTEAGSVMNSKSAYGGVTPAWSNFSSGDLTATRFLYPSSANATVTYDNVSSQFVVLWTTTYFCGNNVTLDVYGDLGLIKSSNGSNTGKFLFDTTGLSPGVSYEFQVHPSTSASPLLYDTESY